MKNLKKHIKVMNICTIPRDILNNDLLELLKTEADFIPFNPYKNGHICSLRTLISFTEKEYHDEAISLDLEQVLKQLISFMKLNNSTLLLIDEATMIGRLSKETKQTLEEICNEDLHDLYPSGFLQRILNSIDNNGIEKTSVIYTLSLQFVTDINNEIGER